MVPRLTMPPKEPFGISLALPTTKAYPRADHDGRAVVNQIAQVTVGCANRCSLDWV